MPIGAVKVAGGGLAVSQAAVGYGAPFILAPTGIAVTVVSSGGLPIADAGTGIFALPSATWDLATVATVTLSGGNLVVTKTGTTSTNQGAQVAVASGKTSGKYYFECKITAFTGGAGVAVGIGATAATYAGLSASYSGGCMCFVVGHTGTGVITANTGNTGSSIGARTTGDVIGIAVDLDNRLCWFRVSPAGLWDNNGSHNPAIPGNGGIAVLAGTIIPFVTFGNGLAGQAGVANNVITANFGASAFTGAVPSGFTSGWPV